MKKTLTVNLGGTVFHIDEDAYRLLDNYLSNLKLHFHKQQGAEEIVTDIENRISELFMEKLNGGSQVITIADVEEVIARVGRPEDFGDAEEEAEDKNNSRTTTAGREYVHVKQRLYRDPDNKMLGGVAAGLAAYFNWDVTWVRILMIVLLFVPYCPVVIIYIILWIAVPEARTAAEKLSMHGQDVTIENIGKTVTDGFEKVTNGVNNYVNSGKPRTFLQKLGDTLVTIAGFFIKACLVIFAVICSPILIVLVIVFVAMIIAAIAVVIGGGAVLYEMLPAVDWSPMFMGSPLMTLLGGIGGVMLVSIPLIAIIFAIIRPIFKWTPMPSGLKWTLFILWILALVMFIVNLSSLGWPFPFQIIG